MGGAAFGVARGMEPFEDHSTGPFCAQSSRRAARAPFHRWHPPWPSSLFYSAGWSSEAPVRSSSPPRPCFFAALSTSFYDPHWGIAAYWLELPGGFLIGAAACCLGLSEGAKKTSWLVAFGLLGSAAVWARQVTGVYLFVACGPLLGAALLGIVLHSATPWRELFRILVAVGLPICLLVGYFLLPRIDMLYSYYGVAGYGYESIPKSFSLIGRLLLQFVSGPYLFVCAAILVAGWLFRLVASGWLYRRLPAWEIWGSLAGSVWLATATFLFLGLSRQIADARHAVFPGIILMLVGCFWPWRSRPPGKDAWQFLCKDPMLGRTVRHFFLGFSLLLFFFSAGFAFNAANKGFIVGGPSNAGGA